MRNADVLHFPSARRNAPGIDVLRQMAPRAGMIHQLAYIFGLEDASQDLRHRMDAAAAEFIRDSAGNQCDCDAEFLLDLVHGALVRAFDACILYQQGAEALCGLIARIEASGWQLRSLPPSLLPELEALLPDAENALRAFRQAAEAEGIVRAARIAGSGQPWLPFDLIAETDILSQDG